MNLTVIPSRIYLTWRAGLYCYSFYRELELYCSRIYLPEIGRDLIRQVFLLPGIYLKLGGTELVFLLPGIHLKLGRTVAIFLVPGIYLELGGIVQVFFLPGIYLKLGRTLAVFLLPGIYLELDGTVLLPQMRESGLHSSPLQNQIYLEIRNFLRPRGDFTNILYRTGTVLCGGVHSQTKPFFL